MRHELGGRLRLRACTSPALVVLLFGGAGCAADTAGGRPVTVRDSAGIEIVENRAPSWREAEGWRVADTPTLEIGAVDSDDPVYELSRVTDVTRLSDGRIVILESQQAELRYFGADGEHLATRGGRGGGPGEFNFASAMVRLPGDTVVAQDRPYMDLVLFAPDGSFLREETLDRQRLGEIVQRVECADRLLPDLSLLLCTREPGQPDYGPDPGPGHLRKLDRYVRVSPDLDSVIPLGLYGGLEQWGISDGGGRTNFVIHPWHSRTVTAVGGNPFRIAIAINPAYSIEVWSPDGHLSHIVRRTGELRIPSARERDSVRARMAMYASGNEALANRFLAEVPEPDSIPAVTGMVIDELNHLWVRQRAFTSRLEGNAWDVFSPDGLYQGELLLAAGFRPVEIGSDYVLGVVLDDNNVPSVRVYALDRASQ